MLNKRIHDLRVAQGYSQVALAKRLGVSKQAVSNWENDNIQDLSGLDEKVVGHLLLLVDDLRRK